MSNLILPIPRGVGWDVKKTPNFSTIVQRAKSGRAVFSPNYVNPLWDFELSWAYLYDTVKTTGTPTGGSTTGSTAGGSYPATTYYVQTTWVTTSGESIASTEQTQAVAASHLLTVAPTSAAPSGVIGFNVYVGLWSGGEILQNASPVPAANTWTMPATGLVSNPINLSRYTPFDVTPPLGISGLQKLMGFFMARQGGYDSFLFGDPNDNYASAAPLGTGDGTTTAFQLSRIYGTAQETIQNPMHVAVFVNGTQQASGYSLGTLGTSQGGVVTFTSAPTSGAVLTASFSFLFRVRFAEDNEEFSEFMWQLWNLKKMGLQSLKL